eukprot:7316256-Pyramimonas_sp.AAC.1
MLATVAACAISPRMQNAGDYLGPASTVSTTWVPQRERACKFQGSDGQSRCAACELSRSSQSPPGPDAGV